MTSTDALCPHCGAPAPSLAALHAGYRCNYCGRVIEATPPPATAPAPPWRAPSPPPVHPPMVAGYPTPRPPGVSIGRKISGVLLLGLLAFGLGSPKSCATILLSGETRSALDAVRKCPRAMALLGDDPAPSWVGCATGESNSGCDSGSGEWSMPISGSRARGTLEIGASKHRTGGWRADSVTLDIDDQLVDVVACKDKPRPD